MQYERSISAIYYLLQGKQSIQTIQDAQLFGLTNYFGVYKNLSKNRFFNIVEKLVKQKVLEPQKISNFYYITNKGENLLHTKKYALLRYLSGFQFRQFDHAFYSRLLLLIQVLTNSKKKNYTYIPIIENIDIEIWVKAYYKTAKHNIDKYLHGIHAEMTTILATLPPSYPSILLDQITSYKTVALTASQIAKKENMSEDDIYLITTSIIHLMLTTIMKQKETYPFLYSIGGDLFPQDILTQSAEKTNHLLNQRFTLQEIAHIRKLKINTIYDHVVEIALHNNNFSLSSYVSEADQKEIIQAIKRINSYKLKEIKEAVNENISYFQIRLVLTQINNLKSGSVFDESKS